MIDFDEIDTWYTNQEKIINLIKKWLMNNKIVFYHGSRLTDEDVLSIKEERLIPLIYGDRLKRLSRVLSKNISWTHIKEKSRELIQSYV